jgi:GTP-binding protein HflX
LVLHPLLRNGHIHRRAADARLAEAIGLAEAIDLEVADAEVVPLPSPKPGALFGSGKVEELKGWVESQDVELVVVDHDLTPVQQRNLERGWKCKVIDRTGLILEIFGERAQTREGSLQVELAALSYQRSRLVRSWTHLERQRGGLGFVGGPGESQLEVDRRLIDERITRIRKDLTNVVRTRELHRAARRRVPYPIVALVGYTNAGKSTLFNRLTGAGVDAEDKLFATLDPRLRGVTLPSGRRIILSDTVGFVSDLPTTLVAAFRATLEEVRAADIIVHVRDIAHVDTEAQRHDVHAVLRELELDEAVDAGLIEALNKIDLLDDETCQRIVNVAERDDKLVPLSAVTGEGAEAFLKRLDDVLAESQKVLNLSVPLSDGAALAWLYQHGDVLDRVDDDECANLRVGLDEANVARFAQRGSARTP